VRAGAKEIDVVADASIDLETGGFIRVSQVIECKWSRDKPWVVFTSRRSRMAESACIAQTAGSLLGRAVVYCLAGEKSLHSLEIFQRPERGGFSGRRAFEKQDQDKHDQFYRTVQSVAGAAVAEAERYDFPKPGELEVPRDAAIVFPIIVVDTNLFEAYYDSEVDEVRVSEVDRLKVFWRSRRSAKGPINSVDIVTAKVIADFARTRSADVGTLLTASEQAINRIRAAFAARSFERLEIKSAPRGFLGLPPLLHDLYMLAQSAGASSRLVE
jgi:hypothetical protein